MYWQPMELEQYAAFENACGGKLCRTGANWWRRVSPFFYRPLNPLLKIIPDLNGYPAGAFFGGVQHAVPDYFRGNSFMNFLVYEDLPQYDLSILNDRRRRETRRSLEKFSARQIRSCKAFVEQGHPIYREFFQRTGYHYRSQRVERRGFEKWGKALFSHPGIVVLGIYQRDRMVAVDISFRLGEVIFDDTFFSNNESQKLHVTNFAVHTLRWAAAATDARWLCRGTTTLKPTLDHSKLRRGARVISLPARYQMNPIALGLLWAFRGSQYRRLMGTPPLPVHRGSRSGTPVLA